MLPLIGITNTTGRVLCQLLKTFISKSYELRRY